MEALRGTNTLVFFFSDNGASDKAVGPLDKPNRTWRADGKKTRVGNKPDIRPGPGDTFVTAGPAWSNLSNAPFRDHKQTNYEGGIASPLIAWWPGVIEAGKITFELSHVTDITATALDVAGQAYPESFAGRTVTPLAGRSLLPVLKGGTREGHAALGWATSGSKALRIGEWKLVAAKDGKWELYDLATDRTELHDLAAEQPERVAAMAKAFTAWSAK
jgi:arylsulfatase